MKINIVENYEALSEQAAKLVAETVRAKPDAALGLATGSTPLGLYQILVNQFKQKELDFSQLTTFNLDEYVGLSPDHPCSYHVYMDQALFSHVNIEHKRIHIPSGIAQDLQHECERYEQVLQAAGGIDLQILGIGVNGHIGFNEPGSDPEGRTQVVDLAESTIQANSRFFERIEDVPRQAITMGIGSILQYSKRIVLLASGKDKAEALKNMLQQQPNQDNPASYLQLHDDVTIIADEQAAQFVSSLAR